MSAFNRLDIRDATYHDIPLIRDLSQRVWPATYSQILAGGQVEYMLELMYSTASLQKQMDKGHHFLIISNSEEEVGFASYSETGNKIFKLHKLYVLPEQQGKGTGAYLIDNIIDRINNSGAVSLQLNVNRHNKALSFYRKLGFEILGEEDIDIGSGYVMNDYILEKKLNPSS